MAKLTRVVHKHKVKVSTERSDFAARWSCRGRRPRRPVIEVVSVAFFVNSFKRTKAGEHCSPHIMPLYLSACVSCHMTAYVH